MNIGLLIIEEKINIEIERIRVYFYYIINDMKSFCN